MARNIVVCCDGTANQIERNLSNVLKLFRIAIKNDEQRVYYNVGIGTIASSDAWSRWKQNAKAIFGLATGHGLDDDILDAYRFICRHRRERDDIFLFGFSRGAYAVRAVAALIHMIGLLPTDQLNVSEQALISYKQASERNVFGIAWQFSKVTGSRPATIKFIGVWDTVASVIVPRGDRVIPQLLALPYTRNNPSVQVFRHAMAIDERRRMFRLNRWGDPQRYIANPFAKPPNPQPQDIKHVWFAGVHADIGGGYPEGESGLSKYPLDWMIGEAVAHGLMINTAMRNHLALGRRRAGSKTVFVRPDALACLHKSLTWGWQPLEWLPKSTKWREWHRRSALGFYLPRGEPRMIGDGVSTPTLHQSVVARMRAMPGYRPENLPDSFNIEP